MEGKAAIVVSCWIAIAIISSVYMWVFASKLGDILFGVFLPVGLLVLVAMAVTFGITFGSEPEKKRETETSPDIQNLSSKLDEISREIEQLKKEIEK